MKIKIYAPNEARACLVAASMNLSLRHWEYAGTSWHGEWADVGTVMDHLQDIEWRMEGLEK